MKITRDVIIDLWPAVASGEASADTRALVEEFLAGDPELKERLEKESVDDVLASAAPALPPDHEMQALVRTKRLLRGPKWCLLLAMIFTMQAFGRIVADTSFDRSPRAFIATACVAGAFWIAFTVMVLRWRRKLFPRRETRGA